MNIFVGNDFTVKVFKILTYNTIFNKCSYFFVKHGINAKYQYIYIYFIYLLNHPIIKTYKS